VLSKDDLMAGNVGIIANSPAMFSRLVEDCGCIAELITPHLLAAPFFRRTFRYLIIPGGFAYREQKTVLYALRASGSRLARFVRDGGTVLVFGAGADLPDAYDWLPFPVRYRFGFASGILTCDGTGSSRIVEECPESVSVDGTLEIPDSGISAGNDWSGNGEGPAPVIHIRLGDLPVMIGYRYGAGMIILTTLHEYPSRSFLRYLSSPLSETLL
jgi:hypothetical protein